MIETVVGTGDSCVDGGAHTGSILDLIIAQAPAGVHVAFEPLPALNAQLHARYADRIARGTLLLYDCALADGDGSTTFHHNVTSPAYSGIRRRRYDNDDTDIELITVEKMRLDDLVGPELRIAFMKLDIEGGEYHALQGARELLERDKPVVLFEFGPGAADHYGVTPPMMHTLFDDLGMDLYALDPDVDGPLDVGAFTQQYETANYYFCAIDRTCPRPF